MRSGTRGHSLSDKWRQAFQDKTSEFRAGVEVGRGSFCGVVMTVFKP